MKYRIKRRGAAEYVVSMLIGKPITCGVPCVPLEWLHRPSAESVADDMTAIGPGEWEVEVSP